MCLLFTSVIVVYKCHFLYSALSVCLLFDLGMPLFVTFESSMTCPHQGRFLSLQSSELRSVICRISPETDKKIVPLHVSQLCKGRSLNLGEVAVIFHLNGCLLWYWTSFIGYCNIILIFYTSRLILWLVVISKTSKGDMNLIPVSLYVLCWIMTWLYSDCLSSTPHCFLVLTKTSLWNIHK